MTPSGLHGIIEADETFIAESFKGKRKISRPARKRGGGKTPQVPIIMVLDRAGNMVHKVVENNTKENIEAVLTPIISADSVLCTDGNLSYIGIAKNLNIDHKRLITLDNQRVIEGGYHIQTLNNYMMRWKSWLKRFCGVGTDYLENYLSWFRFMAQNKEHSEQVWVECAL
ncbi:MAG: IS1595 family transposase [Psychromonas sp.]|nr:IS1595 family transposase [Psychromonas sp.]